MSDLIPTLTNGPVTGENPERTPTVSLLAISVGQTTTTSFFVSCKTSELTWILKFLRVGVSN